MRTNGFSGHTLVFFDSTDEDLRALVRSARRALPVGTLHPVSLWDLRRLDDLPPFDRRDQLGRLRIHLPNGQILEGREARLWLQTASSTVKLPALVAA